MQYLKRVNIIGRETHGDRYRDAALFYPTVESLGCNDRNFADYDTIILGEPYLWDEDLEQRLAEQNFSGLLVMEKMPFSSWDRFERFHQQQHMFCTSHAMLRLFEDQVIDTESAHLVIRWPNLTDSHMSPVLHTLPNALLFCRKQFGMDGNAIQSITCKGYGLMVKLADEKRVVDLEIYDTNDTSANITVNDMALRWPNYVQLIHRFFDAVLEGGEDWKRSEAIVGEMINIMQTINNRKGKPV